MPASTPRHAETDLGHVYDWSAGRDCGASRNEHRAVAAMLASLRNQEPGVIGEAREVMLVDSNTRYEPIRTVCMVTLGPGGVLSVNPLRQLHRLPPSGTPDGT